MSPQPPHAPMPACSAVWALLGQVPDPEIPVLSIVDLGIVRHVRAAMRPDGCTSGLTPTYSGCPATEVIRAAVRAALDRARLSRRARSRRCCRRRGRSDWLSAAGAREAARLRHRAARGCRSRARATLWGAAQVSCPRCGSRDSERLSEFGSTPCKAHYRCTRCREPFDYFKCL